MVTCVGHKWNEDQGEDLLQLHLRSGVNNEGCLHTGATFAQSSKAICLSPMAITVAQPCM
eukprot:5448842-Karenia_brevis.AAC.1